MQKEARENSNFNGVQILDLCKTADLPTFPLSAAFSRSTGIDSTVFHHISKSSLDISLFPIVFETCDENLFILAETLSFLQGKTHYLFWDTEGFWVTTSLSC